MLIQRQQIIHLRQRWIADHRTQAAAQAVIDATEAAQKVVRKHATEQQQQSDSSSSSRYINPTMKTKIFAAHSSPQLRTKIDSPRALPQVGIKIDENTTSISTTKEFLQRELVKLKLEGFLDGRTNIPTLVRIKH